MTDRSTYTLTTALPTEFRVGSVVSITSAGNRWRHLFVRPRVRFVSSVIDAHNAEVSERRMTWLEWYYAVTQPVRDAWFEWPNEVRYRIDQWKKERAARKTEREGAASEIRRD